MQFFPTPKGKAGSDQLNAMEESVQAAIEQMFWQVAKRDSLSFGVGRAACKSSDSPDRDMRLDAQKRECDGLIVFHASKSLETSLQVIYAKVNNRIRGRYYPEVSNALMGKDRKTHNVAKLYQDILGSFDNRPDLRAELEKEFESVYQTAFHKGVHDLIVDGQLVHRLFLVDDAPFREVRGGGLRHGAAITMDHSSVSHLLMAPETESAFSNMPDRTFREFLKKADAAYYGDRNMRWAHYSARDHEPGRTYVNVGVRFFARLVQGLVGMGNEQWMWDEQFARRWYERRQVIVGDLVRAHLQQSFDGNTELPELTPIDKMMESHRSTRSLRTDHYGNLHVKLEFVDTDPTRDSNSA